MKLANIHSEGRKLYLFLRDSNGKQEIQTVDDFFPYYYEKDSMSTKFKSFTGIPLRKIYVSKPSEIRKNRSNESWESDINLCKRYIIDKIDCFDKTVIKYLFIDVEILTDVLPNVLKANKPISCISVYNSATKETKTFSIKDIKDEPAMLMKFMNYVKTEAPDCILGWNISAFDYPYMFSRIKNFPEQISPISKSRYGKNNIFLPAGISIVDYLTLFKKLTLNKEEEYSLDFIAEKHLGKGKQFKNINFNELSEKLILRNKEDVEIMVKLEEKFKLIEYYDEIRRLARVEWEDLEWNSRIVDNLLLQEAKKQNLVLPMKPQDAENEEIQGAYREIYDSGAFYDVEKYDVSSAYPLAITSFCLDVANITHENDENTILINDTYFKQNENALLPSVVRKAIELKNKVKHELNQLKVDSEEHENMKTKYSAIKSVINSIYGSMAMRYFRLYNPIVASTITFLVRDLLHYVKDKLEEKQHKVIYVDTDSCAKDTPVTIKINNDIHIVPIEDLFQSPKTTSKTEFDISKKNYYIWTDLGWSKIKYIYRHKTHKKMYRIITRKGFVELSEDHSLVIDNESMSPKLLKIGDRIELKSCKLENNIQVDLELAWTIGFYLAEGTSGIYNNLKRYKTYHWRIVNQDLMALKKCQTALKKYGLETVINDYRKSSSCYGLDPRGCKIEITKLFMYWCHTKTGDKKIPSFILNSSLESKQAFLQGYWKGDGNIGKKDKIATCVSIDKSLLQGIISMLDNLEIDYSIVTRKDKSNAISLRLIRDKQDKRIQQHDMIKQIVNYESNDYIYDIETENHHFCGGIGNVNLHNSVFVISKDNLLSYINNLVKEWAKTKYNKENIDLSFERDGFFNKLLLIAKCRYIGYLTKENGEIEEEVKGVESKRKDATRYIKVFQRTLIDKILNKESKESIYFWIKEEIKNFRNNKLTDIAFPAKYTKTEEEYKSVPIFMRALRYAKEKSKFTKKLGERFWWIYVKPIEKETKKVKEYFYKDKKLTNSLLKTEWKTYYNEEILVKDMTEEKLDKLKESLTQKGEITLKEITIDGCEKNVIAFDENDLSHVEFVDWDLLLERNIYMKLESIFEAMKWDINEIKGLSLSKKLIESRKSDTKKEDTRTIQITSKNNILDNSKMPSSEIIANDSMLQSSLIINEISTPSCDLNDCKKNEDGECKGTEPQDCPKNNEQSIYETPELLKEQLIVNHAFTTKTDITERTIKIAEAFGLGIDEDKTFAIYDNLKLKVKQGDVVYVTGDSGSGKSWILKNVFAKMKNSISIDQIVIDENEIVTEGVGKDLNDALEKLNLAGLSDAFLYLRRYCHLSDGQKYRYKVAKFIDNKDKEIWILDEFCATLDRTTAKILAYNIQKIARRLNKTLICATTHEDLL